MKNEVYVNKTILIITMVSGIFYYTGHAITGRHSGYAHLALQSSSSPIQAFQWFLHLPNVHSNLYPPSLNLIRNRYKWWSWYNDFQNNVCNHIVLVCKKGILFGYLFLVNSALKRFHIVLLCIRGI